MSAERGVGPLVLRPGEVWAIDEKLANLLVSRGGRLEAAEVEAVFGAAGGTVRQAGGPTGREASIAVIPVRGLILQHGDFWGFGVSTDRIKAEVQRAIADDSVAAVVLDFDSPGGGVYGITEVAVIIREARTRKPVVASVNASASSAAFWLAASASEIVITPSGETGGVGVFGVHVDTSRALDRAGLVVSLIPSDPSKVYGNEFQPLSDPARERIEKSVARYYSLFVADVAAGRGIPEERIRRSWRAFVYGAREAVDQGLADAVGSIDAAMTRAAELGKARVQVAAGRSGLVRLAASEGERAALRQRFTHEDADRAPRPLDRLAVRAKLAGLGHAAMPSAEEPALTNDQLDCRLAAARLRAL